MKDKLRKDFPLDDYDMVIVLTCIVFLLAIIWICLSLCTVEEEIEMDSVRGDPHGDRFVAVGPMPPYYAPYFSQSPDPFLPRQTNRAATGDGRVAHKYQQPVWPHFAYLPTYESVLRHNELYGHQRYPHPPPYTRPPPDPSAPPMGPQSAPPMGPESAPHVRPPAAHHVRPHMTPSYP